MSWPTPHDKITLNAIGRAPVSFSVPEGAFGVNVGAEGAQVEVTFSDVRGTLVGTPHRVNAGSAALVLIPVGATVVAVASGSANGVPVHVWFAVAAVPT